MIKCQRCDYPEIDIYHHDKEKNEISSVCPQCNDKFNILGDREALAGIVDEYALEAMRDHEKKWYCPACGEALEYKFEERIMNDKHRVKCGCGYEFTHYGQYKGLAHHMEDIQRLVYDAKK